MPNPKETIDLITFTEETPFSQQYDNSCKCFFIGDHLGDLGKKK